MAAAITKNTGDNKEQRQAAQNVHASLQCAAQPVSPVPLVQIGIKRRIALTVRVVRIPLFREQMKRKLDLAELFTRQPAAEYIADPASMVLRMRLFSSVISVNITPTAEFFLYHPITSVSRVRLQRRENIEQDPSILLRRLRAPRIHQQQDKRGQVRLRSLRFRSSEIIRRKTSSP